MSAMNVYKCADACVWVLSMGWCCGVGVVGLGSSD